MHSSEHYYSSLLLVATNIMVIYVYTYVHVKDNRQKVETKSKLTGEIIIQQKCRKDEVILWMMKVKEDAEGGKGS